MQNIKEYSVCNIHVYSVWIHNRTTEEYSVTYYNEFTNACTAGMAKGGGIPKPPPLESKILENPYS